jgi:CubicO group peptidase (beta-lactamase class C family)
MKGFDIPGLAIGIVANDRLVYAKGFGVRSKNNRLPVDARTGKLNLLRLSTQDGQAFEFRRE